jgi:Bacterial capsule synthesis protein PGA_cap
MRSILIGAAVAVLALSVGPGCASAEGDEDGDTADGENASTIGPIPSATGPIRFTAACRKGTSITIAAVGDVLLHSPLQKQAYSAPDGHHSLWKAVEPLIARADLAYANLEGPCAHGLSTSGATKDPGEHFDNVVYTSYPQFNYHDSLVGALEDSGFDVVSTANNHAMDRRVLGADETIDALRSKSLPFSGTRKSSEPDAPWFALTESHGVRVAWLACSFSTNGIPDAKHQVLHCYEDKAVVLDTIKQLRARKDVDVVLVTPHWGEEYHHAPEKREQQLAHDLIEAGALAVIGNHPHVVQPMEKYVASDGRETFVLYSLGNFVSGQSGVDTRSSMLLYLGLTKGADGVVTVNGVRHLPLYMDNAPFSVRPADRGGAADSLALTTRILGQWNRIGSDERLVTNPECP